MEKQNYNPNNIQIDGENVNHVVNNVQNSQQYINQNNTQYSSNQNNYNQYNQRYFSDERLNNIRNDLTKFENELNDPRYKKVRLQEIKAQEENSGKTKKLKYLKIFLIFMALFFPGGTILALVFYCLIFLRDFTYEAFVEENTEKIKERFIKDFNYKYDFDLGDKKLQIKLDYNNGGYENYDFYSSKNVVSGILSDDSRFIMAGIETEEISKDGNERTPYKKDIFNGIFISITLPFKIPAKIQLEPNKNKQKYNESRLELESADFENQYDLLADDRAIAIQIFTPEVIEDIMTMTKKYKTRISLHIYEDRVLFRMYYNINWMDFYNQSDFEEEDSNTIKDYINNEYLSQSYEILMLPEVISLSITRNMKGKYFNSPSNSLGQINNVVTQQISNQQYQPNIAFNGNNNNYNKVSNDAYQQQNLYSDETETKIQNNTWDLDGKEKLKSKTKKIVAIVISIIIIIIMIISVIIYDY